MPARYDPAKHHRRSIRLRGYDYSTAGAYFITIGTHHHARLFGAVADGIVRLSAAGAMIEQQWQALPGRFPAVALDTWVIMPDHVHAIVWLHGDPPVTLGAVIGAFKSLTTNAYSAGVREQGWPPFDRRLWERDYYEHIIRSEDARSRISHILSRIRRAGAHRRTRMNNDYRPSSGNIGKYRRTSGRPWWPQCVTMSHDECR